MAWLNVRNDGVDAVARELVAVAGSKRGGEPREECIVRRAHSVAGVVRVGSEHARRKRVEATQLTHPARGWSVAREPFDVHQQHAVKSRSRDDLGIVLADPHPVKLLEKVDMSRDGVQADPFARGEHLVDARARRRNDKFPVDVGWIASEVYCGAMTKHEAVADERSAAQRPDEREQPRRGGRRESLGLDVRPADRRGHGKVRRSTRVDVLEARHAKLAARRTRHGKIRSAPSASDEAAVHGLAQKSVERFETDDVGREHLERLRVGPLMSQQRCAHPEA